MSKQQERKLTPRQVKSMADRAKMIDRFFERIEALIESGQAHRAYMEIRAIRLKLKKWKEWM